MATSGMKTRVMFNNNHTDLPAFKAYVDTLKPLQEFFDVRVIISHHHKLKFHEKLDKDDPYLFYSLGFAALYDFVVPKELLKIVSADFVKKNAVLIQKKSEILEKAGLKAAFAGHEPVYYPEAIYEKYPEWRGPRIDHPRRSKNPCFAMCMHNTDVQNLYRGMSEKLIKLCPNLDTFYFWANDSGSGFCWNQGSYFGANGPEICSTADPKAGWNNFQSAILDGARDGGAKKPMSVVKLTAHFKEAPSNVEGAYEAHTDEPRGRFYSIGTDLFHTYPVSYLHNPFEKCERWAKVLRDKPELCNVWFSDVYQRMALDNESIKDIVALVVELGKNVKKTNSLSGKVDVLKKLASDRFRPETADELVDAWHALSVSNETEKENMRSAFFANPTYLGLSHRWLTRPLVAYEDRLTDDERKYYMPFIFSVYGDAGKMELLDAHGKYALPPNSDYGAFDSTANKIIAGYKKASALFTAAAAKCSGEHAARLKRMSLSCQILICLWKNVRNGMQFALLRKNGHEKSIAEIGLPLIKAGHPIGWLNDYQKILFRTVRNELDNIDVLIKLLKSDKAQSFHVATTKGEEETFTVGPDIISQLEKRKKIMMAHIQDLYTLFPNSEVITPIRYWFP
ncbi:MAG: hypothetical protein JNL74_01970 [Fibrobacteres bacterium]|nr:hypothetical protein [Fibrobacterota bacterium]